MKDGEGRDIDFKNTVILMTTNAGTDLIKSLCSDPETAPEPDEFNEALFPELLKTFKPAFLGRLSVVPYYPLSDDVMRKIIELKLGKVARRITEHYKAQFPLHAGIGRRDRAALHRGRYRRPKRRPHPDGRCCRKCPSEFLARMAEGESISAVEITVGEGGEFQYLIR
jgi:type VI secretion system protein VasG